MEGLRGRLAQHSRGTRISGDAPFGLRLRSEHDFYPADTAALDLTEIAGFCTSAGGPTSHTVQIAYSLGIPTVVAAGDGVLSVPEGQMCALDGDTGTLYVAWWAPIWTPRLHTRTAR